MVTPKYPYGATIGKTSIFNAPLATNQACAVAQPNEDIDVVFLYYYLLSQKYDLIRKGQGGAQPNISQGILKEHPINVPRIEEQNQIVQEIETRLSVCDNILANIEEGLEKSEALRQSILKQAFEGKLLSEEELEACRKEPDWEPAEQLLARIKAGKETSVKKEKAHAKQAPKKKIHHVEYYKRTLLAAEIVWQLHIPIEKSPRYELKNPPQGIKK